MYQRVSEWEGERERERERREKSYDAAASSVGFVGVSVRGRRKEGEKSQKSVCIFVCMYAVSGLSHPRRDREARARVSVPMPLEEGIPTKSQKVIVSYQSKALPFTKRAVEKAKWF